MVWKIAVERVPCAPPRGVFANDVTCARPAGLVSLYVAPFRTYQSVPGVSLFRQRPKPSSCVSCERGRSVLPPPLVVALIEASALRARATTSVEDYNRQLVICAEHASISLGALVGWSGLARPLTAAWGSEGNLSMLAGCAVSQSLPSPTPPSRTSSRPLHPGFRTTKSQKSAKGSPGAQRSLSHGQSLREIGRFYAVPITPHCPDSMHKRSGKAGVPTSPQSTTTTTDDRDTLRHGIMGATAWRAGGKALLQADSRGRVAANRFRIDARVEGASSARVSSAPPWWVPSRGPRQSSPKVSSFVLGSSGSVPAAANVVSARPWPCFLFLVLCSAQSLVRPERPSQGSSETLTVDHTCS
ncbi:uncharacterized protein B0I36DRAFT_431057 [Microdochium trichocladiopsis]|uniref:Uncharacterized protein n=1 Tax=Microdochium trichocladiopsis TaxID=1682393 RepID=A0A9P9BN18_9PEZI|nr:uncharacterized protein B0I36DRAFT_431057 [Microdochium trichocladiopsis]KAH7030796.1 hypothetical protein B0I36DRAFT_431057 [Microdochium trichocladiopsis]